MCFLTAGNANVTHKFFFFFETTPSFPNLKAMKLDLNVISFGP